MRGRALLSPGTLRPILRRNKLFAVVFLSLNAYIRIMKIGEPIRSGEYGRWQKPQGRGHYETRSTNHILSSVPFRPSLVTILSLIVLVSATRTYAVTADNPYQAIVGRNVFSLKPPPPPPNPEDLIKKEPPPKIKLQGLNTILGRRQVLFKVPAKPPGQPKEESFVMNEGERQGEIEVLEINMQAESVRFRNHAQEQLLNMKDDADKPAIAAVPLGLPPGAIPGALPGVPPPPAAFNQPAPGTVTTIGGPTAIPQRTLRTSPVPGGVPAGTGFAPQGIAPQTVQQASQMSPEEAELSIELKRRYYQEIGHPSGTILPHTSMTPQKEPPIPQ